jgi:hypothetical protein
MEASRTRVEDTAWLGEVAQPRRFRKGLLKTEFFPLLLAVKQGLK